MVFKHAITAGLIALAATTPAQAADWYLGGSLGGSDWKVSDVPAGVSVDKTDVGYKLFGGASFTPNFALEGGYANFGKSTVSVPGASGNARGYGYFLDLVGILPVGPQFGLLARLGAFNGHGKIEAAGQTESDSGTDVKYGVGLQYNLSKTIGIRGEWERYRFNAFDDKQDVDLWSIGVTFGF